MIVGTNDMVVLASMVVEFILTLLLLLNILVSLMHTRSFLIKDLVVNPLEIRPILHNMESNQALERRVDLNVTARGNQRFWKQ